MFFTKPLPRHNKLIAAHRTAIFPRTKTLRVLSLARNAIAVLWVIGIIVILLPPGKQGRKNRRLGLLLQSKRPIILDAVYRSPNAVTVLVSLLHVPANEIRRHVRQTRQKRSLGIPNTKTVKGFEVFGIIPILWFWFLFLTYRNQSILI